MTTRATYKKENKIVSPYVQFEHGDLVMFSDLPAYNKTQIYQPLIYKVKDLPDEIRPREKMIRQGSTSLSLIELLAIVLGTGTKKEDVLHMASRLIREYGTSILSDTGTKNISETSRQLGIPETKVCQILAIREIGKRLFSKNINGLVTIRTPEDVYEYVKDMHNLPKEQLRGLYLDTHHKVIHDEVLSIGTINASMIHPREVFKPALEYSAAAVILVHNHPSGVCTPSQSDILITEQIVKAGKVLGISVLDHVVVTRDGFASVPVTY